MGPLLQRSPASWLPTMQVLSNACTFTVPQPVCYLACLGLRCSLHKCLSLLSVPPEPTRVGLLGALWFRATWLRAQVIFARP